MFFKLTHCREIEELVDLLDRQYIGGVTLDYHAPDPPARTNHDHIYTTLLGVAAFFVAGGMITLRFIEHLPQQQPQQNQVMPVFSMIMAMEGLFLAAMLVVLAIRIFFPAYRRWPTVGINIILLLWVPFGTALAIYGFLKVDKKLY